LKIGQGQTSSREIITRHFASLTEAGKDADPGTLNGARLISEVLSVQPTDTWLFYRYPDLQLFHAS